MINVLIAATIVVAAPSAHARDGLVSWWRQFCEQHLVQEDPYQFEHLVLLPDKQLLSAKRSLAIRLHEVSRDEPWRTSTIRVYRSALLDVIKEIEERKLREASR